MWYQLISSDFKWIWMWIISECKSECDFKWFEVIWRISSECEYECDFKWMWIISECDFKWILVNVNVISSECEYDFKWMWVWIPVNVTCSK